MNKIDIIEAINNYSFNDDKNIINIMNDLLNSKEYKIHFHLMCEAISITQLYGFLSYFDKEELAEFLKFDSIRSNTYKGNQIPFYNIGQLSLLYEIEKNDKVFFSAPTSFGKTSLVMDYILGHQSALNNILFIVPTNSLLEELYIKISKYNKKRSLNYNVSTQPYIKSRTRNFMILTPERFLIMCEDNNINDFDLVIMDEAYKIVDSKNNSVSDFIESRALRFRKVADIIGETSKKLILLSPFTYELTTSMKNFLEKYNIIKIDRRAEYVKRNIYEISNANSFKEHFAIKVTGYCKDTSIQKKTAMLLRFLSNEKNIVYVSNYSKAYEIIDEINWQTPSSYNKRYIDFLKHLEDNYSVDSSNEWKIITALKKGIGIYISPLPRYIKKEIINLYNENILHTLIVTTAFTEGVNTNACNLIFTSLINGPTTNKLSDIDVLNVLGRAGRFAQKSVGNIYCLTSTIYKRVIELQNDSIIKLENYNYLLNTKNRRNDYEIDMMDEQYLTDDEKNEKSSTIQETLDLGLSQNDLRISLNVSTKWKLCLYKYFLNNSRDIAKFYNACKNIISDKSEHRLESLLTIFVALEKSFEKENIEGFACQPYEIKPFSSAGNFTWGNLYGMYCSGNIAEVISSNIKYVTRQFNFVTKKYNLSNYHHKNSVSSYFASEKLSWILNYYHADLSLNFNAFYSETFKFISNIIQYKIPFYTSYFVSILKLYVKKNQLTEYDTSLLDSKKVALLFEDGNIFEDYSKMIDFGLPNDIIIAFNANDISFADVLKREFNTNLFDNYENTLIDEFIKAI